MSDYLDHLVIKSLQPEAAIRPRLPARYEPWVQAGFGAPAPDPTRPGGAEGAAEEEGQPSWETPARMPPRPFSTRPDPVPAPPGRDVPVPQAPPPARDSGDERPALRPAPRELRPHRLPDETAVSAAPAPVSTTWPRPAASAEAEDRPLVSAVPARPPNLPWPREERVERRTLVERLVIERAAPLLPALPPIRAECAEPLGKPGPDRGAEHRVDRGQPLAELVAPLAGPRSGSGDARAEGRAAPAPLASQPGEGQQPQIEAIPPVRQEPPDEVAPLPARQTPPVMVVRPRVREAPPAVAPPTPPAEPAPVIRVTIGRVEVRATPAPPAPKKQAARAPAISLDAYLERRTGGGR